MDEETISELKAKHGEDLHLLNLVDDVLQENMTFVVKRPRAEYDRFRKMIIDPEQRDSATKTLVSSCVVYPAPGEFLQAMSRYSVFWEKIADQLTDLAGATFRATVKKL